MMNIIIFTMVICLLKCKSPKFNNLLELIQFLNWDNLESLRMKKNHTKIFENLRNNT